MRTITIASGKGGAGKTVIAVGLGRILIDSLIDNEGSRPRVLVLDLDLHGRGLTYLMYPQLDMVPRVLTSMEDMIRDPLGELKHLRRMVEVSQTPLIVVPASLRPYGEILVRSTYLWEPMKVLESLEQVLIAAADLGVDFAIIDTRAGPDVLSTSAASLADVTWLILEQDRISWRTSLNFLLQTRSYQDHLADEPHAEARLRLDKAEFLFLPNKVTRYFRREVQDVLGTYDFLPAIPLDTLFFERYTLDPFEALSPKVLGKTRFGKSIAEALQKWMQLAGISETYRFVPGSILRLSPWERLAKLYSRPELFLSLLAVYALVAKWVYLFLKSRFGTAESLISLSSDLILLTILLLLMGRRRY